MIASSSSRSPGAQAPGRSVRTGQRLCQAIEQAYLAQQRSGLEAQAGLRDGAGQIGLLTTLMLRLKGHAGVHRGPDAEPGLKEESAEPTVRL